MFKYGERKKKERRKKRKEVAHLQAELTLDAFSPVPPRVSTRSTIIFYFAIYIYIGIFSLEISIFFLKLDH